MAYKDPEKRREYQRLHPKTPEQKKLYDAVYRATHRNELRAKSRLYDQTHRDPEKRREYESFHRKRPPEYSQVKGLREQERYYQNPERYKERGRAYRATHRDELRAKNKVYRQRPEVKVGNVLKYARRIARQRGLPNTLTLEQWEAILRIYKNRCAYCGKLPPKGKKLTQDHVLAQINGGGYTPANIVPACGPCNFAKGNREPANLPAIRLLI